MKGKDPKEGNKSEGGHLSGKKIPMRRPFRQKTVRETSHFRMTESAEGGS